MVGGDFIRMKIARRLTALVMTTFVAGAFLAIPASADTPERFAGTAAARALNLTLLGNNVTIGSTNALGDSSPLAQANGAGVLLVPGTVSTAEARGANAGQAPPEACVLDLPLLNLLSVAVACSQSAASTAGGVPNAASTARIAALDLGVLSLLDPLISQLTPLVDQTVGSVTTILDSLLGNLLTPILGNLGLTTDSLVSDLLDGLERATGVLAATVGPSASALSTTATAVTASSSAQGAVVDLLPGFALTGAPLVSIVVGEAKTVSTFDRSGGASSSSFDPAIARVTVPLLGLDLPVQLGAPLTLFAGTPLESTISLGAGRTVSNPDGTKGSVADGVSIQLLNHTIGLELAHAESAIGGAKGAISEQTIASVLPAKEILAKTGGESSWLPIGGFALLFVAFLTRRALTRR
jgi:hypothetical protein